MFASEKHIGIASAAVLAAFIAIVANEVSGLIRTQLPPASEVYKRCDGRSDPVEEIRLSSCPDIREVGYCELDIDDYQKLEMSFTPANDYGKTRLVVHAEGRDIYLGPDFCQLGARCSLEKGRKEKIVYGFWGKWFTNMTGGGPSQVKFGIYADSYPNDPVYCVEFPVKIVKKETT